MDNKRTLFLSLGTGIVTLVCMFMPLWMVTKVTLNSGNMENDRYVFNVFSTPFLIEKMPEKYNFLSGLFVFFIIIIIIFTILCIAGGLSTYKNDSTQGKIAGTIGAIGLMLVFFAIMVIASFLVGDEVIGWGEFPCIAIFGISIPYIWGLFSDPYRYRSRRNANEYWSSTKVGVGYRVFANTTVASLTGEIIPENTIGVTKSKTIRDGTNVFFEVVFTLDDGRKVNAIVSEQRLSRANTTKNGEND